MQNFRTIASSVSTMTITSVERAFRVLRALDDDGTSLSEVARRVGLPVSTTSRFLGSLAATGAVSKSPDGAWTVGPTIHALAGAETVHHDLFGLARHHLVALSALSEETAGIAAAVDDSLVHLGQITADPDAGITVRDWTGVQVAAHSGCTGQVLMAHWPDSQLDRYLDDPLEAFSNDTVTDPAELRRRIEIIREQHWYRTTDEYAVGVTSLAAPVRRADGKAVAALHVFGPTFRFPHESAPELEAELCRRADELSEVIGFVDDPPSSNSAPSSATNSERSVA